MGSAADLSPRHTGNERFFDFPDVLIGRQTETADRLFRIFAHPGLQLLPETGPRFRKSIFFVCFLYEENFSGPFIDFGMVIYPCFIFFNLAVSCHFLYHALCRSCNDHRIDGMVKVSVFTDFMNAQTFPDIPRHGSVHRYDSSFSVRISRCKLQSIFQVVIKKTADILGILQMSLFPFRFFITAVLHTEQVLSFFTVFDGSFYPGNKFSFPLRFIRQVFHGRAVSFISVFLCQDKHFVAVGIIKGTAVGQDVIDFGIGSVVKQFIDIKGFLAIGTIPLLLFIQFPFHDILSGRTHHMKFF